MNCKRILNLTACIIISLSAFAHASDIFGNEAVRYNHAESSYSLYGESPIGQIEKTDQVLEKINDDAFVLSLQNICRKIKWIPAIAIREFVPMERPLEIIGIFEYKSVSDEAVCINDDEEILIIFTR